MGEQIEATMTDLKHGVTPQRVAAVMTAIEESGFCTVTCRERSCDVREEVLKSIAAGECGNPAECARAALADVW